MLLFAMLLFAHILNSLKNEYIIHHKLLSILGSVQEFIREVNEMKWNDHKGMKKNGMECVYIRERNGKEWNGIELSNLDWMF